MKRNQFIEHIVLEEQLNTAFLKINKAQSATKVIIAPA